MSNPPAAVWVQDYDHDFSNDAAVSAGGANSHVIHDGNWIDVHGGVASIAGSAGSRRLVMTTSAVTTITDAFVRDPALVTPRRDNRIVGRIAPGDAVSTAGIARILISNYVNQTYKTTGTAYVMAGLTTAGTSARTWIDVRATDPDLAGPGPFAPTNGATALLNSGSFVTLDNTHYYDMEVICVGSFANRFYYLRLWDQGVSPPVIGAYPTGIAVTSGTSTTMTDSTASWTVNQYNKSYVYILSGTGAGSYAPISSNTSTVLTVAPATFKWTAPDNTSTYAILAFAQSVNVATNPTDYDSQAESANRAGTPGMLAESSSAGSTMKWMEVATYHNSSLQPAIPNITSNTSAGVGLNAYDFSPTGAGIYAEGGAGALTFYWHRSTTVSFSPSNGTRLSGALTGAATYLDSTVVAGTTYYYALETTDGVTQVYQFFQYSTTAAAATAVIAHQSGPLNLIGWGHSFLAGTGSSSAASTSMIPQAARLVAADAFGMGARTCTGVIEGHSSATMLNYTPDMGSLYRLGQQRMVMSDSSVVAIMLTTNDNQTIWTSTPANITTFWRHVIASIRGDIPLCTRVITLCGPPDSITTLARAKQFALYQAAATDGRYAICVGQDTIDRWNITLTSNWGFSLPQTCIGKASSATTAVLTDTSKSGGSAWTVNQFQNLVTPVPFVITSGTGAGQTGTIASNTANTFTYSVALGVAPDNTSSYAILQPIAGAAFANYTTAAVDPAYSGATPYTAPPKTTDLTHPNDWGYYLYGASIGMAMMAPQPAGFPQIFRGGIFA